MGRKYRSKDCRGCSLAAVCLSSKTKLRQVRRDQYDEYREEVADRMQTEEGKAFYRQRAPQVEGKVGTIKGAMGIRRFLRRGHEKVSTDWLLICLACNVKSLIRVESGTEKSLVECIRSMWRALQPWWSHPVSFEDENRPLRIDPPIALRAIL